MKHKRIYSIILLSIFVLSLILPLQTALSHCNTGEAELRRQRTNLEQRLTDAEDHLQYIKNKGYLKTMTEKQREAIIGGTVIGATTGLATGLATAGIWSLPLAIKGGIIGAVGGTIGGPIYGYFSHKAALEAAEEAVTKAKDDLDAKELELL